MKKNLKLKIKHWRIIFVWFVVPYLVVLAVEAVFNTTSETMPDISSESKVWIYSLMFFFMQFIYLSTRNGLFYKRKSIRYVFSYVIGMLKESYDFEVDNDTMKGHLYLTGMIKDFFVSVYLHSEQGEAKNKYYVWYKIVAFGYFGDEILDNKIIIKEQLFNDTYRCYSSQAIVEEIVWDIDHFDIKYY
jgi:hypothetical protein